MWAANGRGGDDDDTTTTSEVAASTETTEGDAPTTTADGGEGGGGAGDLDAEDFAASGITDFGDEAQALWVPDCAADLADTAAGGVLSDDEVEAMCQCVYDRSEEEMAFDQFLEQWYSDESPPPEPIRGIIEACTLAAAN